jgi:hypothetical protein
MTRTASVGVDVDSLRLYYRIHGLDDRSASNAAWRVGVARFEELFAELGIKATFFCVAEDLDLPGNTDRLRRLVAAGHEIGNHTWRHPYELTRQPPEIRRMEVGQGRFRLEAAAEAPVLGFRSPGYNTDAALQKDVLETGHRYDSSVFPCLPYYAAKAAILGMMRLRGRESRSILGTPKVLMAPRAPYVGDRSDPHVRGQDGLVQFPIAVFAGVPLIGTAFTAIGERASAFVCDLAARTSGHLTIEFHAADLLSLRDDGLDPALAVQPDLRAPVDRKRRIFRAALKAIQQHAQIVRLADLHVVSSN